MFGTIPNTQISNEITRILIKKILRAYEWKEDDPMGVSKVKAKKAVKKVAAKKTVKKAAPKKKTAKRASARK